MTSKRPDWRVERGNQTRQTILKRTMEIASIEGLSGLSLGRVANELHLSKSGVFALFGSMEELQLATIRAAIMVYIEHVLQPCRETPPGVGRVWKLCLSWLDYSRNRVFPGGCFFHAISAEFDARTGQIHDTVAGADRNWARFVETTIDEARKKAEITPETDPSQLAFELIALLEAANASSVMHDDPTAYDKATIAILNRLRAAAVDPGKLPDKP